MLQTQLSTGFIVGTSFTLLLLAICTACGILGWIFDWFDLGWMNFAGFLAAGTVITLIYGFCTFPWSAQYHEYRPISGRVQAISSRFIGQDGGGSDQVFAITLHGQAYKLDDTRGATLHVGSPVTILCIREYQFNGTPGYTCNWGKAALNG